jgi:hypothetical protein
MMIVYKVFRSFGVAENSQVSPEAMGDGGGDRIRLREWHLHFTVLPASTLEGLVMDAPDKTERVALADCRMCKAPVQDPSYYVVLVSQCLSFLSPNGIVVRPLINSKDGICRQRFLCIVHGDRLQVRRTGKRLSVTKLFSIPEINW